MKLTTLLALHLAVTLPFCWDSIMRISVFVFLAWLLFGSYGLSEVKFWKWTFRIEVDE